MPFTIARIWRKPQNQFEVLFLQDEYYQIRLGKRKKSPNISRHAFVYCACFSRCKLTGNKLTLNCDYYKLLFNHFLKLCTCFRVQLWMGHTLLKIQQLLVITRMKITLLEKVIHLIFQVLLLYVCGVVEPTQSTIIKSTASLKKIIFRYL